MLSLLGRLSLHKFNVVLIALEELASIVELVHCSGWKMDSNINVEPAGELGEHELNLA